MLFLIGDINLNLRGKKLILQNRFNDISKEVQFMIFSINYPNLSLKDNQKVIKQVFIRHGLWKT